MVDINAQINHTQEQWLPKSHQIRALLHLYAVRDHLALSIYVYLQHIQWPKH